MTRLLFIRCAVGAILPACTFLAAPLSRYGFVYAQETRVSITELIQSDAIDAFVPAGDPPFAPADVTSIRIRPTWLQWKEWLESSPAGATPFEFSLDAVALNGVAGLLSRSATNFVSGRSIPLQTFSWLRECIQLQFLDLSLSTFSDEDNGIFDTMTELRELRLGGTRITDRTIERVVRLPSIRHLDLSDTAVSDAGIALLVQLPQLESLYLGGTKVTDRGLESLSGSRRLRKLFVHRTAVSDLRQARLAELIAIEDLSIAQAPVIEGSLRELRQLHELRLLDLGHTPIGDAEALAIVNVLPRLERLYVDGTNVTEGLQGEMESRGFRLSSRTTRQFDNNAPAPKRNPFIFVRVDELRDLLPSPIRILPAAPDATVD